VLDEPGQVEHERVESEVEAGLFRRAVPPVRDGENPLPIR
jgi:hypothetical protein